MLQVDFMFADSTTDFVLVIFDDSSLLIGVQVWSPIFIMWLSLSLISTDAMASHKPPVEQRQAGTKENRDYIAQKSRYRDF